METITEEDVRTLLPGVAHIDKSLIDQDANTTRNFLVLFGIRNRQQLARFVESKEIFDFLAQVYVRDLDRPSDASLDPTAVAVWGAILFTRGLGDDVKNEIIKRIQQSPEYSQKHQKTS